MAPGTSTADAPRLCVLHFAGSFHPVPGGTTARVSNLLASPQHDHQLFVPWPTPADLPPDQARVPQCENFGHIHVSRVKMAGGASWRRQVPLHRDRCLARAFCDAAADTEADLLHGHNPLACALAALTTKRRRDLPMVYEVHGIMHDMPRPQRPFKALEPLNWLARDTARRMTARWERRVLDAADRVIVQTDAAGQRLAELYGMHGKPVDVIHNGVDAARFDPQRYTSQRASLRAQRGWEDRLVCLYAGYLNAVNGIDFLLSALPTLSQQARRRLKFVLLGRGPLQESVATAARTASDLVEYAGLVDYDAMPCWHAASDVFVIPRPAFALGEVFLPMKLLEAMAMARVVLVSDVGAMADVVHHNENGLVFRRGNAPEFVRCLESLTSGNDHEHHRLGARARADVLEKYTWDSSRLRLSTVYRELVT